MTPIKLVAKTAKKYGWLEDFGLSFWDFLALKKPI